MENFKNYMQKKNIDELQIFLKNSSVDLLKTIAKRYKLPVSTKRKELIIQDILQSVKGDRPFLDDDQPLHVMTIPQLRNKARQLNIDFSNLHKKQELRLAIIQKMAQLRQDIHSNLDAADPTSSSGGKHTREDLEAQKLPFLKNLAKSYKIKVSKLSKNQLITLIMEAEMMGKVSTPSKGSQTQNLEKMRKNELIVLADERGLATKGKKKEELVRMLKESTGVTIVPASSHATSTVTVDMSFPPTEDVQERMRKDRKLTVRMIRDLLTERNIAVPKGTVKRDDLLTLLFAHTEQPSVMIEKETTAPPPPPPSISIEMEKKEPSKKKKKTKKVVIQEEEEEEEEIVSEDEILPMTTTTTTARPSSEEAEEDVVSMDDIQTPFEPIALENLLEEPSEKQLQEELYRCLQFYEHPN